ncbi:hypothetical protein EBF04_19180 [Streptomyces sp. I6]|nr:hypothetical protein EBF04_19180 [Streptomyces sp. I6]
MWCGPLCCLRGESGEEGRRRREGGEGGEGEKGRKGSRGRRYGTMATARPSWSRPMGMSSPPATVLARKGPVCHGPVCQVLGSVAGLVFTDPFCHGAVLSRGPWADGARRSVRTGDRHAETGRRNSFADTGVKLWRLRPLWPVSIA